VNIILVTSSLAMGKRAASSSAGSLAKKPSLSTPTSSSSLNAAVTKDDGDGWIWHGTLLYYEYGDIKPSSRIASFDYDGCLANTSLFKKGPDAWSVLFPGKTENVLKEVTEAGYKLVIMTNQSEIGRAKAAYEKTVAEKKSRLLGFVKKIGLPCQIYVATAPSKAEDPFRKPGTGMWEFLEEHKNGGVKVDRSKSFFVGDAAGRPKDHSDTDLKMAQALGVTFYTEQQMFKEQAYKLHEE